MAEDLESTILLANRETQLQVVQLYVAAGRVDDALRLLREMVRLRPEPALIELALSLVDRASAPEAMRSHFAAAAEAALAPNNVVALPRPGAKVLSLTGEELAVPSLRLDAVVGLADVKRRLRLSFLGPLQNPALREKFRTDLRGGLLLWGPPGCGKTMLGKALAGELTARFLSFRLDDILGPHLGESERNMAAAFATARENRPSVVFLDEIDALGQKRTQLSGSALRGLVVMLLDEMDGIRSENEGLYFVGATNHPWDLDSAIRRSGRLDHSVFVPPPDEEARTAILRNQLRGRPCGALDLASIGARTLHYSGADLALLCKNAAELALDDAITDPERVIAQSDLEAALAGTKATTLEWLQHARKYAAFGVEREFYRPLEEYLAREQVA